MFSPSFPEFNQPFSFLLWNQRQSCWLWVVLMWTTQVFCRAIWTLWALRHDPPLSYRLWWWETEEARQSWNCELRWRNRGFFHIVLQFRLTVGCWWLNHTWAIFKASDSSWGFRYCLQLHIEIKWLKFSWQWFYDNLLLESVFKFLWFWYEMTVSN